MAPMKQRLLRIFFALMMVLASPMVAMAAKDDDGGEKENARYLGYKAAVVVDGRSGTVLCRRDYFEAVFREEVVQRYLAEFHPMSDASRAA